MLTRTAPNRARSEDHRYQNFDHALRTEYPGAMPLAKYVAESSAQLRPLGFRPARTLACVASCRDEIARPLTSEVEDAWGQVFSLTSLAGMLTAGRTGVRAAVAHAPIHRSTRRLIVFAMPHVAIDQDGTIGVVRRSGVQAPSQACGALTALLRSLNAGDAPSELEPMDIEQSFLRQRLGAALGVDTAPNLIHLTRLALETVEDDLWQIVNQARHHQQADHPNESTDFGLFTGILIHGPKSENYIWPSSGYVRVGHDLRTFRYHRPEPGRIRTPRRRKPRIT